MLLIGRSSECPERLLIGPVTHYLMMGEVQERRGVKSLLREAVSDVSKYLLTPHILSPLLSLSSPPSQYPSSSSVFILPY